MDTDTNQKLEYLYKEYVRLNERADELIKDILDDFKLFGAAGATIVLWKPISEILVPINSKLDPSAILFLGFLSILGIAGIISYLGLLKHAYAWYFVRNLQAYEIEIKKILGESEDSELFNFNLGKSEKKFISTVYKTSSIALMVAFFLFINLMPFIILCYAKVVYAVIYLVVSLLGSIIYFKLLKRVVFKY